MSRLHRQLLSATLAVAGTLMASPAGAQWSTTYEQFYQQAPHNWIFRAQYQYADRLFNAFDYGHAILYETLWRFPSSPAARLEEEEYTRLTTRILVKPPRIPLEEGAIEIKYAQLAPEAKVMFDWAHILHRQLYDVLADERLDDAAKDAEVARLIRYYKSRPDLAFSSRPKTMALMQEQPYSLAFRKKYPKFNGLIWGYHWLQMALYEPLLVGRTAAERQAGARATVARFWQMLTDAPRTLPYQMPMTVAIAPRFAERYEEAAIIFDNLHSMHDVVSDILTNPSVPRNRKRAEIMRAAQRYRDDTTEVMPVAAWRTMSLHMGVENMGGPAVGFLPTLPTPTVTAGAVMQHDRLTGAMTGFGSGGPVGGEHAGHVMPVESTAPPGTGTRFTSAEVAFMQGMMGHHAQAVTMSALVADRATLPAIRALAERITVSQQDELTRMREWLTRRGQTVPMVGAGHEGHGPAMPGMLTAAELAELAAARGPAFDRRFLQLMIRHHEGAVAMVAELLRTSGAGQDPLTFQFVSDVDADQRAEIRRMQALLASLPDDLSRP